MPTFYGNSRIIEAIYAHTLDSDFIIVLADFCRANCHPEWNGAEINGVPDACMCINEDAPGVYLNSDSDMYYVNKRVQQQVRVVLQVGTIMAMETQYLQAMANHGGAIPDPMEWIHETLHMPHINLYQAKEGSHLCHHGHRGCLNHVVIERRRTNIDRHSLKCFNKLRCACGASMKHPCTHDPQCLLTLEAPFCALCNAGNW